MPDTAYSPTGMLDILSHWIRSDVIHDLLELVIVPAGPVQPVETALAINAQVLYGRIEIVDPSPSLSRTSGRWPGCS